MCFLRKRVERRRENGELRRKEQWGKDDPRRLI
jgi:hypothetical protein